MVQLSPRKASSVNYLAAAGLKITEVPLPRLLHIVRGAVSRASLLLSRLQAAGLRFSALMVNNGGK